ncbi:hypothetical protein QFZ70_003545 [Arthrobacter sp. V1I9]|nr:hypothetical protein [Arthrobacter sp. V1I9]
MEYVKERLVFTGEDSPIANLMLSVMGALAELERALIRERQREGISLAQQRGVYEGRKRTLSPERAPNWSSARAVAFVKSSLPAITGSAGSRSTNIPATPGWTEAAPEPALLMWHGMLRSFTESLLSALENRRGVAPGGVALRQPTEAFPARKAATPARSKTKP